MLNKKALAASVSAPPAPFVEDVFSTFLYTGTGASQTITNGIDLAGKGGLVWTKGRSAVRNNKLVDTARGAGFALATDLTDQRSADSLGLTAFNANGYNLDFDGDYNGSGINYVGWTFRKQPKFMDIVTWTGNGSSNRQISHSLGSAPGMMIVKCTSTSGNWSVYHRSRGATERGILNLTNAFGANNTIWNDTAPTSTVFTVGDNAGVNADGATYVAYLFAHNAGGFGTAGTDNVISCGSFTTDSSGNATVNLGYEPQYILCKYTTTSPWYVFDVMRGFSLTAQTALFPNSSSAENTYTGTGIFPTATGFSTLGTSLFDPNATLIYMAIRRPMKVPTTGTEVFYSQAIAQSSFIDSTGVPFPPDLVNTFSRNGTNRAPVFNQFQFVDRLRGLGASNDSFSTHGPSLVSSSTNAEATGVSYVALKSDSRNITRSSGWNEPQYGNWINYFFRRAPGFLEQICYQGTGSARTVTHNLGVAPELMFVKSRSATWGWHIYNSINGATQYMRFNTDPSTSLSTIWNDTSPTSSVFTVGSSVGGNQSGTTYVAYLFATCPGVSKVGSYTGNGGTQAIACGFTGGARFVLIKRTDADGDWYVYDTARGMTLLTDPYLRLNSTAAESATLGSVTTTTGGFTVDASILAAINTNAASYIFLAIS